MADKIHTSDIANMDVAELHSTLVSTLSLLFWCEKFLSITIYYVLCIGLYGILCICKRSEQRSMWPAFSIYH